MIFVCKGQSWINRLAPAFRITHTYGFQAENVHVHHAGGMGLIAENPAIKIEASQNVRFEGNMYEGDATEILEVDSLLEGLLFQ